MKRINDSSCDSSPEYLDELIQRRLEIKSTPEISLRENIKIST